jgi:NTP pyrophosphatase (non-canonical NTP hydrolase)
MDTKDAQALMRRIYYERDVKRGIERTLLRTFQELGELSETIQRNENISDISSEMADVFAWVCSIANLLNIDLSDVLYAKYTDVCYRCGKAPCECVETP